MSYIIKTSSPFISTKLTQKGRERLASGQLTFGFWAIGDSEINYDRETIVDNNPNNVILSKPSMVLRPKDDQPNLKYFISSSTQASPLTTMTDANIRTMKLIVNNQADERGFFSGDPNNFITKSTTDVLKLYNTITSSSINGGNTVNIGVSGSSIGDFLAIKVGVSDFTNNKPVPCLWYKIQNVAGTTLTLDRVLPSLSMTGSSMLMVYKGGEVYNGIGSGTTTAYWDTGTLSFDSSCDITREDVPVWNMNNIFDETLGGITGTTYEDKTRFGSYDYLGQMVDYLGYKTDNSTLNGLSGDSCNKTNGVGSVDSYPKSLSIVHYTNNTISNLYGEFFHIDMTTNKTLKIHLPDIMYHRRGFSGGTGTGSVMGMSFLASGATQQIEGSELTYIELMEEPTMMLLTPKSVGKVFPQLKIVVFEDPEIISAMSYKANRNWTLPELNLNFSNPNSPSTGLLQDGETMYVTYSLDSTSGLTTPLQCQTFARITNNLGSPKDVEFRVGNGNSLPYMKKKENVGYDNSGFYAHKFKVIYQIVSNDDRPNPNNWKVLDFTSTNITTTTGQTINPILLENQSPAFNNQVLTSANNTGATQFDITQSLSMAPITSPDVLQFGDERFFYGNIETYIGATIYKTMFDIRIDGGQYDLTSNPTRSTDSTTNPPAIKVSEIGIYDNEGNLVVIGKLSNPTKLVTGQTIMMEISLDF